MPMPEDRYCSICKILLSTKKDLKTHTVSKSHLKRVKLLGLDQILQAAGKDRNGILITTANGSFAVDGKANAKEKMSILVTNLSSESVATMEKVKLVEKLRNKDVRVLNGTEVVHIPPGSTYTVTLEFQIAHVGYRSHPVEFQFENGVGGNFHICKVATFRITKSGIAAAVRPAEPYTRVNTKSSIHPNRFAKKFLAGLSLKSSKSQMEQVVGISPYEIFDVFRKLVVANFKQISGMTEAEQVRCEYEKHLSFLPLVPATHWAKFYQLLQLEELAVEAELSRYDQTRVTLRRCKEDRRFYVLDDINNLAESRPSVLVGDSVFVKKSGDKNPYQYEGKIHRVELDDIWIGFHQNIAAKFPSLETTPLDVAFKLNRMNFRVEHRAVEIANRMTSVVFPTAHKAAKTVELSPIEFYNGQIESNLEQSQAVLAILDAKMRPSPYLLFGPPGTGKSVVVVEAILQILKLNPKAKILGAAPSNSAADLLVDRLRKVLAREDICRLNAVSRDMRNCTDAVRECSFIMEDGSPYLPKKKTVEQYKVVVSTLTTASRLVSAGLKKGYFSYIFIDEAGQATEPQSLTAVAGLYHVALSEGLVVLAGDPKQLGPVVQSDRAKERGLATSWLERLMTSCDLYQRSKVSGHFNRDLLTKLLRNYRSHRDILAVPNELFYDNELIPNAAESITHKLCDWTELPNPGFPIIFHGVVGEELRERHSPSFFNPIEMEVVKDYVEKLMEKKVRPEDIGIISPYKKQVQKLSGIMGEPKITIGSVEQFQGAERQVIIISTVRSDIQYLKLDAEFRLGFLNNPKRFNTACTRAKALLIVVGNPSVLSSDPNWNRLIQFCRDNNAYRGCPLDEDSDVEDVTVELSEMAIN